MGIVDKGLAVINQAKTKVAGALGKVNVFNGQGQISLIDLDDKKNGKGKVYDVIKDYKWTLSPNRGSDVPLIRLIEYEQDVSTLYAQLAYWINNIKTTESAGNGTISPYENLYHAIPTGTEYILPYFEPYDHNINQKWGQVKGIQDFSVVEKLLRLAGAAAQALKMAPGTSVNQPRVWSGSDPVTYSVTFKLFNTDGEAEIERNLGLKQRLQFSTLHDQRSAILASPPALFEVEIPGIRYCPAAVISQLAVTNLGQMNRWNIGKNGSNIPDAYEITLTIAELITESRQILNSARTGNHQPVRAITQISAEELLKMNEDEKDKVAEDSNQTVQTNPENKTPVGTVFRNK